MLQRLRCGTSSASLHTAGLSYQTVTAARTTLKLPQRDGGHAAARHAALARSAIAPYPRRTVG
jgi:hypothetical protein